MESAPDAAPLRKAPAAVKYSKSASAATFLLLFPFDTIKMRPLPRQPGTPIPRFFQRMARRYQPFVLQDRAGDRVDRPRVANCLEKIC